MQHSNFLLGFAIIKLKLVFFSYCFQEIVFPNRRQCMLVINAPLRGGSYKIIITSMPSMLARPSTLTALKRTNEALAESLDKEEGVQSARHNRKCAQAYLAVGDASF